MIRKYFFILIILSSCAVQVPPSGGPRDTKPPKVEKMIPENKTINFDRKEIQIRFDEFIVLKNPEEQIVISPPLDEKPEYEMKGKILRILLRGSLKRNTTYTINFGYAITDNHEGNIQDSIKYVFSTGSVLDSNMISGKVLNAFTRNPEKNIVVGLYDSENFFDSIVYKKKPLYYAKTSEKGAFKIENIPSKQYFIFGFNDENKNLKYNKNEDLFYNNTFLGVSDSLNKNKLFWLFIPDKYESNRILDTFCHESGKFSFLVYKPNNFIVKPVRNVPFYVKKVNSETSVDSIFVFSNLLRHDSVVYFKVSTPDTSLIIKITQKKKLKPPLFSGSINGKLELNDSFKISLSNPFESFDTTRIILKTDTLKVKYHFVFNQNKDQFIIIYPLKEKTKYSLFVKDSAFKDMFGQFNKKTNSDFATHSLKDYGSLKLNLLLSKSFYSYIIQLTNSDESIVFKEYSIEQNNEQIFEYLLPATYKIKIIRDENRNVKWDNGDYLKKLQPEIVYYYSEPVSIKAYWDIEQTVDLNSIINK